MQKRIIRTMVRLEIKEGTLEKMTEHVKASLPNTLAEPGCISAATYQDKDHSNVLYFIEDWESIEDFEAHMRSAQVGKMDDFVTEIASGKPEFITMKRII